MSLRRRLLLSLGVAVLVAGAISAMLAYDLVNRETKNLLDNQLQQIAVIVGARGANAARPQKTDEDIEIGVWDAAGKLEYASTPLLTAPLATAPGFSERSLGNEPYRLYATTVGARHIEVAQPVDTRDDQAEGAAVAAFMPVLILLPVLVVVIALVLRAMMHPIREVAASVSRRSVLSSEALQGPGLPMEIAPLLDAISRLLERQGLAVQRDRQFIDDAAHALRTPLTALQLQADVLDGSTYPLERAARLKELKAGVQRISRLVEQLLSLARIESGAECEGRVVVLAETLREVCALYSPAAAVTGVTMEIRADDRARVLADPPRVLLMCSNLVDNAVRHSPPGGLITLGAALDGEMVRLEICDEGTGLDPDQFERVFERFYSLPGSNKTGNGLGLATVESVVKQLGGRVSLHNRTDRSGLIARVLLPRVEDSPGADSQGGP
jgi:signal transduction histidine kinase